MSDPNEEQALLDFDLWMNEIDADPGAAVFPNLAEAFRRAGRPDRAQEIARAGLEAAPQRLGGRVAMALACLDLNEIADASQALAGIIEDIPEVPPAWLEGVKAAVDSGVVAGIAEAADEQTAEELEHPLWARPLAEATSSAPTMSPVELRDDIDDEVIDEEIDEAFESAEADPDAMLDAYEFAEEALGQAAGDVANGAATTPLPHAGFDATGHPTFATETMANLLESQGDLEAAREIRSILSRPAVATPLSAEQATVPSPAAVPTGLVPSEASGGPLELADTEALDEDDLEIDGYDEMELEAEPVDAAESLPESLPEAFPDAVIGGGGAATREAVSGHSAKALGESSGSRASVASRARILATLERWLENIQREVA